MHLDALAGPSSSELYQRLYPGHFSSIYSLCRLVWYMEGLYAIKLHFLSVDDLFMLTDSVLTDTRDAIYN